jgi:hypothetical protein
VNDIIIMAPGTGAATSQEFAVERGREVTIQIYPLANIGANTAVLKRKAPDDTYVDCYDEDGAIVLGATRPQEVVLGYGKYILTAAARTLAWGISKSIG